MAISTVEHHPENGDAPWVVVSLLNNGSRMWFGCVDRASAETRRPLLEAKWTEVEEKINSRVGINENPSSGLAVEHFPENVQKPYTIFAKGKDGVTIVMAVETKERAEEICAMWEKRGDLGPCSRDERIESMLSAIRVALPWARGEI